MENDITQTTQTDMENKVDDFEVDTATLDTAGAGKETTYMNGDWTKQLGYFKTKPEINRPITSLAIWTAGKGYTTDPRTEVILDNITGWGEDTFNSIMINMIKVKKYGQDSYCEVIRNDKGTLINLKPLNTGKMKHVVGQNGIIKRYEYQQANGKLKKLKPPQVLHLCNDRCGDEIHGTSVLSTLQWAIDAKHEAMTDWKRISHRSTIRVLYVDMDDKTKLANLKKDYAEGINKGELLILPCKKGDAEFQDLNLPPVAQFLEWIRYLENYCYQIVGVPRDVATTEGTTESGSKMGTHNFEPIYSNERIQLEKDLWNQLAIKVTFTEQPNLTNELQQDAGKDTGQMGFQPNDVIAGRGK